MPLGSRQSNGLYLKVVNSKIAQTVPEGTEGAVKRELQGGKRKGQPTWELMHDYVAGQIDGGEINSNEYGKTIHLHLKDSDGSKFIFQIPWNSSMRDQFSKRIPNIDVSKPLEINVFPDQKTEKPVLLLKQESSNIPFAFTRENPNGLPEWKRVKKMGEETIDKSEYDEFLYNLTVEFFEQFDNGEKPTHQEVASDEYEEEEKESSTGEDTLDEDVPF